MSGQDRSTDSAFGNIITLHIPPQIPFPLSKKEIRLYNLPSLVTPSCAERVIMKGLHHNY